MKGDHDTQASQVGEIVSECEPLYRTFKIWAQLDQRIKKEKWKNKQAFMYFKTIKQ